MHSDDYRPRTSGDGDGAPGHSLAGRLGLHLRLPRTVRGTLLILVLVVFVPVLLVALANQLSWFAAERSLESQANLELTQALSGSFDQFVGDVSRQELTLGTVLSFPALSSTEDSNGILARSARGYPSIRYFSWVDAKGTTLASSDPSRAGSDASGSQYYKQLSSGSEMAMGDLHPSQEDGRPVFTIARGIRDGSGRLQGIVMASVDATKLADVLRVEPAHQQEVDILDERGVLAFNKPHSPVAWEERDWALLEPSIRNVLAGQQSGLNFTSPLDHTDRAGAVASVGSSGWVVVVSSPKNAMLTPVALAFLREVGLLAIAAIGSLGVAVVVSRRITMPLAHLANHIATVGGESFSRDVHIDGPRELEALAAAFNNMSREIRLQNEQREDYVHALSHDLRTPLAVIIGQATTLQRYPDKVASAPERFDPIIVSARRMNDMIQDLVDSARLESGQLRLNLATVNLPAFVFELKVRLAGVVPSERIRIADEEGLPAALADPTRLERILSNLVTNAFKYSAPGSDVAICFRQAEGQKVISVSDEGPGIPDEEIPRLFQRFHRSPQAQERHEGLGLGLYVTKMLVEVQGGNIWVESEPGRGTTFSVSLRQA